jgi:hypothetical protein
MSLSKIMGAIVGVMFGAAISGLYLGAALENQSAPATAVIGTVLLATMVGAVLGAYIGSHDNRAADVVYLPESDDVEARLARLEALRTRGLVTEGEYEQRRAATLEAL